MADLYLLSFASAPIYSGLSLGPVSVSSDILLPPFEGLLLSCFSAPLLCLCFCPPPAQHQLSPSLHPAEYIQILYTIKLCIFTVLR